jgi:hypothetical protein
LPECENRSLRQDRRRYADWVWAAVAISIFFSLWAATALAESREHGLVLEIGPAAEWPLRGERPNYGGTIALEKEVIENWLELELGITGLGTSGQRELSTDLLFKKPFHLFPTVEFMVGVGPSIAHTFNGPDKGTSAAIQFVIDFMFWPQANVGWYVEPAFSIKPRDGQKSFGLTGGLLIGLP